jgi:hypothetical protein
MVAWTTRLREIKAEMLAQEAKMRAQESEPWRLPLERLQGTVGADGIERISTQAVFDVLQIPQRSRGAGACRRLSAVMRELGWRPIKARGLNQRGLREQIRGYARDKSTGIVM